MLIGVCAISFSRSSQRRFLHQAELMFDVVLELSAEMLDEALHWQRRGIAQRADGASRDVVGHRNQLLEIFASAFAVLDALHHAIQPTGAFAARRALAARFLEVKEREPH